MPAVSVAALRTRLTPAASVRSAAATDAAAPAPRAVEGARARLPRRSPRCRCSPPSVPTYDPWAWIIWGREITHLDLNTVSGPSWKPLPVLFTTPFALFGDDAAPALWLLIVARRRAARASRWRTGSARGWRAGRRA